ncbi:MAG: amidohydrolase [Caldisericaceae bacterium]
MEDNFRKQSVNLLGEIRIFTPKAVYVNGSDESGISFVTENGKITLLGATEKIKERYPFARQEFLDGFVYPSFFDAHVHLSQLALLLSSVDATDVSDFTELKQLLKGKKESSIFVYNLDFNKINESEFVNLFESNLKVFIQSRDEHSVFVSKALLNEKNIRIEDVEGGGLLYVNGSFAGVFKDNAISLVKNLRKSVDSIEMLKKDETYFLSRGITSIVNFDFDTYNILKLEKDNMNLRVVQGIQKEYLNEFIKEGVRTNEGDQKLKIGAVKCFLDGSLGSQTAYMKNAFPFKGLLTMAEEEFKNIVMLANTNGIQVAVHAIGSGAVNIALRTLKNYSNPAMRNRIEHLQFIDTGDLELLRDTNFIASMQPIHAISDYYLYKKFMSDFRYAYAWRTVQSAGKVIAFGSDAPVEDANPIIGMYAASYRKTLDSGLVYLQEETIPLQEALRAYTLGAAYASFSESYLGELKENFLADFVLLDNSLLSDKILERKVLATYIGGELVWMR